MANMKNAKKKILTAAKENVRNNDYSASMKTACKSVLKSVDNKDKAKANENLKVAIKKIDKAKSAGVITDNKAARNKSSLTKKVNAME